MSAPSSARDTSSFLDLSGNFHLALDRLESRLNAVKEANSDDARASAVVASLDFLVRFVASSSPLPCSRLPFLEHHHRMLGTASAES
jgi:hypothetical protein